MSAVVEVNEALALFYTPPDVAEQYANYVVSRHGCRATGFLTAEIDCCDRDHAVEVVTMLAGWGIPKRALKVRSGGAA